MNSITRGRLSNRGNVPAFLAMDVMAKAAAMDAAGRNVLHLEIGQPSVGLPQAALDETLAALAATPLGYTEALGRGALRERIATHYTATYGETVSPGRIIIGTGSSGGFELAFIAAFDAGAKVALAAPGYPAYRHILTALDIEPVLVPVGPDTDFQITPEAVEAAGGADLDGLIVASPANPTGTVLSAAELSALATYCAERNIRLISDEIYHGISFGKETHTAANLPGGPIVLNSFSKYFCMTGWRLGWMVVPQDMARRVECLAQNLFISPPTPSQIAAEKVFDHLDALDDVVAGYAANRQILLQGLPRIGLSRFAPTDGAFYVYVDVGDLTDDSVDFCARLLEEAEVAATPGVDFDPFGGNRAMRLSFAGAEKTISEAVTRMGDWISRQ